MELEDIKDRDSLDAWLKGRPREDAIWIAHRAAMRVMPLCASLAPDSRERKRDLLDLSILRSVLTSGVGRRYATREVKDAAAAALAFADAVAASAFTAARAAARADAAAAFAATRAAVRAAAATDTASVAAFAASRAATASAASRAATAAEFWMQINNDCMALQRGDGLEAVPLWHNDTNPFQSLWGQTRAMWRANPHFDFWLKWYEAALMGAPLNWPLMHDIALILDTDWAKGIGHVAGLIEGIELQRAIAATPNAERIVINPATGLLRLETVSELPADHLADALDMMRDAQSIFEGKGEGNHPYETIADERALIDRAIAQYAARPRMIYNTCMRVIQRIESKKTSGDCPSKDANIDDYQGQLGSVAVKLMAHDGEVKASVIAETETRLNQATPALRKQIVLAATALADESEGILKDELPDVAAIAADPKANEKDRQVAIYQTSSRLLRGWVALKGGTKGVSDHIEKHPTKYGILAAVILAIIAL